MFEALLGGARKVVSRILRRDYNYEIAYGKVDLEKDYWSIVGAVSGEEWAALGIKKRELLTARGLTPSSRLLDVGCGTGQLAAALEDYLRPDALYVGTDIAAEAVIFCQKKFRRPNFRFARNEMTGVPVTSETFDFIFFGSVFTHMYPPEVTAMLRDVARLLETRGSIIADAFFSPGIGTSRGNRGMVVIDEDLLLRCFRDAGYVHEVIDDKAWEPGVRRAVFQLRRRIDANGDSGEAN